MLGAGFGALPMNAGAVQSAPDSYGYSYTDSKSPAPSVSFDWIEINDTGTDTGLTYYWEYAGPLSIGFDFEFYGNIYSEFYVATNGFISFGYGSGEYWNEPIPDSWDPNNFVAAYWDELSNYDGKICYETVGVAPNRQLVVEWVNVTDYWGSNVRTFEIILNETGDIWCQYLSLNGATGSSATVGIENEDGDIGTQYSYNTASLTDGLAMRFSEGPVSIGPDNEYLGTPGETVVHDLLVTNRQPFNDSFEITHMSDLGWTVGLYDLLMNPLADTDGDLVPDTGIVPSFSSAAIRVTVDIPMSPASLVEMTYVTATSHANASISDSCTLRTQMIGAWFSPPHADYGYDPESDGEYNYLIVEVSLNVHASDWYYVEGYLYSPTSVFLGNTYAYSSLGPGSHTMDLRFFGWVIRDAGQDGPYRCALTLYDSAWEVIDTDEHFTAAYSASQFMEPPATTITPFSDAGVDTDSDGLYDHLAVDIYLDVNYATDFQLQMDLYDADWEYVSYRDPVSHLEVGSRTVQITFDAYEISRHATVSGQFWVYVYLYAFVYGAWIYLETGSHRTAYYDLSSFERPGALFHPPHSDYVTDPDGDWLYDYLVIQAGVNVSVEGDYSLVGVLRADSWAVVIDTVTNTTHLTVGVHTVELWYPGWPIRYNADSDDMDIELTLMQGATVLDTDDYTTWDYYYYWDFEGAPGWLEPPYSESAVDLDSDMLYDYVLAQVPVTVTIAGTYELYGELSRLWTIDDDTNTTYLPVGTTVVELRFEGWMIRDEGWNGPYDIDLYLYDTGGREMDYDWFSTAAYSYTDFETVPAQFGWPHEAYAQDTDSDGDLDGIFVNASVVVDSAGTYDVVGVLYDSSWSWVANSGTTEVLDVGDQVVRLAFPAWLIRTHGWSGNYWIELYLFDGHDNDLDYDSFSTASYAYDAFDSAPPRIDSGWADAAPTIDGVLSPGEWADAALVELVLADPTNQVSASLLVTNDGDNLYICYDAYGDTTNDLDDSSSVAFDTGNDDFASDGAEHEFWMTAAFSTSEGHMVYSTASSWWVSHCSPFSHPGLAGAVGFGASPGHAVDHRVYEYSIPLSLLGISPGDVIGFFGGSHSYPGVGDADAWDTSTWPVRTWATLEMDLYGEIRLAEEVIVPPVSTTAAASGTMGTNGWYRSGVNVTLTATGGEGGVDYTEYTLDGGSWTTYSAAISIQAAGVHTLEYRSVDNGANVEATKSLTVRIDRTAPVTVSAVSETHVWLNATDATSGLAATMYRIDGGTWQTYTGVLNITGEGTHTIEFYSVDMAGNSEAAQSLEVEVEEEERGGGLSIGDWTLWIALAVIAIIAAIAIGAVFMMRRKARESDARSAVKDIGTSVSQMMDEGPPKPPETK